MSQKLLPSGRQDGALPRAATVFASAQANLTFSRAMGCSDGDDTAPKRMEIDSCGVKIS